MAQVETKQCKTCKVYQWEVFNNIRECIHCKKQICKACRGDSEMCINCDMQYGVRSTTNVFHPYKVYRPKVTANEISKHKRMKRRMSSGFYDPYTFGRIREMEREF